MCKLQVDRENNRTKCREHHTFDIIYTFDKMLYRNNSYENFINGNYIKTDTN